MLSFLLAVALAQSPPAGKIDPRQIADWRQVSAEEIGGPAVPGAIRLSQIQGFTPDVLAAWRSHVTPGNPGLEYGVAVQPDGSVYFYACGPPGYWQQEPIDPPVTVWFVR